MTITIDLKIALFKQCNQHLNTRLSELKQEYKLTQQSASEDTKSSMGDKYETSHAMAHLEKEKLAASINEIDKQLKVLNQVNISKALDSIQVGSLVETSNGLFLIGVSLGKMKHDSLDYFAISAVSPLGKQLAGKRAGEEVVLNGRAIKVLSVC